MKRIISGLVFSCICLSNIIHSAEPQFASGIKIGEVNQDSAIVWVRLTQDKEADFSLLPIFTKGLPINKKSKQMMPLGVVSGKSGEARVKYWIKGEAVGKLETKWQEIDAQTDFTHQFKLINLIPNKHYEFKIEARNSSEESSSEIIGRFKTAPMASQEEPVSFIVSTCQAIRSIDSGQEGHVSYKQMLEFDPDFFVHTGDILYYDKAPHSKTVEQARAKWGLMFSYGHNRKFHRYVGSYFMKDDHDTLRDDAYPGMNYGDLTFNDGLALFREQVPMNEKTYRTVRWGRDVQVWMLEGRDYRSKNTKKDGPNKTILGKEQKEWLKKTVKESSAKFKFIISPGPIVGPDKKGKKDNHSNRAFQNEGQELRDFIAAQKNTFVICGDRHWQYCSKDPKTGVLELGCGPISTQNTFGGNPGENADFHRYFGAYGGFLAITVEAGQAKAEWYMSDLLDNEGKPKIGHTENLGK